MNPSLRLVALLAIASCGSALVPTLGVPWALATIPVMAVLAAALADRLSGTGAAVEVRRSVRPVLSVGTPNPVALEVRNRSGRDLRLEIADEHPDDGEPDPDGPIEILVPGWKTATARYRFSPARRGRYSFEAVRVRHRSRLGLWLVRRRLEVRDEVQVFPNIAALGRFELLAQSNSLSEIGVRTIRMKGDGTEFERMREYRPGDDPRRVDWKTTARIGRLTVREMGEERNQNVLFMIDAGRMMRQTTDGLSHFDWALNTAIILGHIAQKRGDNIGAVLFSDEVKRFVPLGRGRAAVDALVHATYDAHPDDRATNYRRAFKYVMSRVSRRSLLLLMTHPVPGEDQRLVRGYMKVLGGKHLPLCLFFREPAIEEQLLGVPVTAAEAFRRAAAADVLLDRREGISALRHAGVMAVDARPGELSAVAIGQYLDVKARNLL